jgi:hypothetical protein
MFKRPPPHLRAVSQALLVWFYPISIPREQLFGLAVAAVGLLANALSSILGRHINRSTQLPPTLVTVVSMGIGAAVLLGVGVLVQGLPQLTITNWLIILCLAIGSAPICLDTKSGFLTNTIL